MSLKTILIGLSIFRFGGEKSVHGRPSCELASYDCSSENTVSEDFAAWCKLVSKECGFNDRAGKCGVVRLQKYVEFDRPGERSPEFDNLRLRADEIKLWFTPSAKQRRIRLKGNSKRTSGNSLSPLGVQNKDLCAASQTVLIRVWLSSARRLRQPVR